MTEQILTPFCYAGTDRPHLSRPFSLGEWTYATNGHIAVRVPRRPDVPESETSIPIEKLFADFAGWRTWAKLLPLDAPQPSDVPCSCYDGRLHDCPSCECNCPKCDGSGLAPLDASVGIGEAAFDAKYIRMIAPLPGLLVPPAPHPTDPMPFCFKGGEGILMPLRGARAIHVVAEITAP
jgi:hypothetical protein